MGRVSHCRGRWVDAVLGAPFALLGLYLVAGRFVVRHRWVRATRYVITSDRVIVAGWLVHRWRMAYLPPSVIKERRGDSGDLGFGSLETMFNLRRRIFMRRPEELTRTLRLRDVDNVRQVRELVGAAQIEARAVR